MQEIVQWAKQLQARRIGDVKAVLVLPGAGDQRGNGGYA